MKKIFNICLCGLLFIYSCNNFDKKAIPQPKKNNPISEKFVLNGTLSNYLADKIYLNKIIENSFYPIDSSSIIDNKFKFEGIVEYPERYALSFENYSSNVVLIIENLNFEIQIESNFSENPIIKGSPLNELMGNYKNGAKNIFKKIDYLFPKFQKARLENDAEKLAIIDQEMKNIEVEFRNYTYNFIKTNKDSYVAVMILRDQLKNESIDSNKIIKTYNSLPEHLKSSPDALILQINLDLH